MTRGLGNFLTMDRPEHHNTNRTKERGVEPTSHPPRSGTAEFNLTDVDIVSKATSGRLPRDGSARRWAFSNATMPSYAETGSWKLNHECDIFSFE